jgi:hypothetical protein
VSVHAFSLDCLLTNAQYFSRIFLLKYILTVFLQGNVVNI